MLNLAGHTHAYQVDFKASAHNGAIQYDYKWFNMKGEPKVASFKLFRSDVQKGIHEFKAYDQQEYETFYQANIQKFIKFNKPNGMQVDYHPSTGQFTFSQRRKVEQKNVDHFMDMLKREQSSAIEKYFKNKYYNYNTETNELRPAHGTIAKRYVTAMRPVAKALYKESKGTSSRDVTNHVLSFIQSIPYNTLQDPRTSNGAGYQTPYGVIHGNKGDCDSKSVMFASIMRNLYPYARIVVIYVPGHALVGFDYQKGKGDYAIQIGGTTFVLAEPVGPALKPLGQISSQALQQIRRGSYSYEEVPL